ncbi:MAG: hypothetical protein AAF399_30020 [Bacteroidota bacterium]
MVVIGAVLIGLEIWSLVVTIKARRFLVDQENFGQASIYHFHEASSSETDTTSVVPETRQRMATAMPTTAYGQPAPVSSDLISSLGGK